MQRGRHGAGDYEDMKDEELPDLDYNHFFWFKSYGIGLGMRTELSAIKEQPRLRADFILYTLSLIHI